MTTPTQNILLRYQYILVLFAVAVAEFAIVFLHRGHEVPWFAYWWMFPIAFTIALTVNTAGISGAALFVPFFILIFPFLSGIHLPAIDTVKLGLITESFGLSSSALAFFAFGLVDVRLARGSILAAIPFIILGAFAVSLVPGSILYLMVAVLLIIAALLLQFENILKRKTGEGGAPRAQDEPPVERTSIDGTTYRYAYTKGGSVRRFLGYAVGGGFQGATGFGIGEMGIISMMLSRIPVRIAIGTSHLVVAAGAVIASIIHFAIASHAAGAGSQFAWNIPVMTIPAVFLGGQLAPYVAAKLPIRFLERFISVLFIIIATALVVVALRA